MFEWQKYSQKSENIPPYDDLLEFLNLRAQATESSLLEHSNRRMKHDTPQSRKNLAGGGPVLSYIAGAEFTPNKCVVCRSEKHPLYACSKFRGMPHDDMVSALRANGLCMNCLGPNHFVNLYTNANFATNPTTLSYKLMIVMVLALHLYLSL